MLSLTGEIAARHSQSIQDPVVIGTVDALDDLSTNLSRKIRKRIMILNSATTPLAAQVGPRQSALDVRGFLPRH